MLSNDKSDRQFNNAIRENISRTSTVQIVKEKKEKQKQLPTDWDRLTLIENARIRIWYYWYKIYIIFNPPVRKLMHQANSHWMFLTSLRSSVERAKGSHRNNPIIEQTPAINLHLALWLLEEILDNKLVFGFNLLWKLFVLCEH